MPHCMVPMCSNGWRKTKGTDITYHRLPTYPLSNVWLQNIRRENPRNLNHSFVCSAHFTVDCFEPATEICGWKKRRTLKPSAVPTLFVYNEKDSNTGPSSVKRIIREDKVSTTLGNQIPIYNVTSTSTGSAADPLTIVIMDYNMATPADHTQINHSNLPIKPLTVEKGIQAKVVKTYRTIGTQTSTVLRNTKTKQMLFVEDNYMEHLQDHNYSEGPNKPSFMSGQ